MKVLIAPHGTHGDLRPLVALGIELRKRSHEVVFACNKSDKKFLDRHGFSHYLADFNIDQDLKKSLYNSTAKEKVDVLFRELSLFENILYEKSKEADLVIGSGYQFLGSTFAELHNKPYIHTLHSAVFYPSASHPPADVGNTSLPGIINKLLWLLNDYLTTMFILPFVNRYRKKYKLRKYRKIGEVFRDKMILSINHKLSPIPSDVNICKHQTDYWHLFSKDDLLSNNVLGFLQNSNNTIYIGFGSMPDKESTELQTALKKLLDITDFRFIISSKISLTSELEQNYTERILIIGSEPHFRLFPYLSLVVHHGGAGTTSTALYAGTPQLIIPHMADQFYFAKRIYQLKIGPKAVMFKNITKELPDKVIEGVTNREFKINALKLKNRTSDNSGLTEAVEIIENSLINTI